MTNNKNRNEGREPQKSLDASVITGDECYDLPKVSKVAAPNATGDAYVVVAAKHVYMRVFELLENVEGLPRLGKGSLVNVVPIAKGYPPIVLHSESETWDETVLVIPDRNHNSEVLNRSYGILRAYGCEVLRCRENSAIIMFNHGRRNAIPLLLPIDVKLYWELDRSVDAKAPNIKGNKAL